MIKNLSEKITVNKYKVNAAECANTHGNNGDGYTGFIGGVEITISKLDEIVPAGFIHSSKTVNEVETQKTWREYCLFKTNEITDDDGNVITQATKALLFYLHVWEHDNRDELAPEIECKQWRLWYEHFGVELLTKSEFDAKVLEY